MSVNNEKLEHALEYALSQTPTETGARLRSERDLEAILQAGRRQINSAMNRLANRGLLVRQRGSGSYVRKIPKLNETEQKEYAQLWQQLARCEPEELYVPRDDRDSSGRVLAGQKLSLSVWSDWMDSGPARQMTMAEMIRRAQQAGHALTFHSIVDSNHRPLPPSALSRLLKTHPSEGYLVVSRYASLFMGTLQANHPPVVFCGGGMEVPDHEPYVISDNRVAVSRAVDILARNGFKRIALWGLHDEDRDDTLLRVYQQAMERANLAYRNSQVNPLPTLYRTEPGEAIFQADPPPDALILADDHLIGPLQQVLQKVARRPGVDLGLICQTNHGVSIPGSETWSQLEVDPRAIGRLGLEMLLESIQTAEPQTYNIIVQPTWKPGQTHQPIHGLR
jgi:DNA-binding LacI/PurR family transcriptional regulator